VVRYPAKNRNTSRTVQNEAVSKTALFAAARAWEADKVTDLLLAKPELIALLDRSDRTALDVCAAVDLRSRTGVASDSVRTAEALIDAGLPVDRARIDDDDGEQFPLTALWQAVGHGHNLPLAAYLLDRGASPRWCLWAAVYNDDPEMVQLLVRAGAPIEHVAHGDTPLVYAVRLGRPSVIPVLVAAGASLDATDPNGRSLLQLARRVRLPNEILARLQP
jgi:uncharacterized protein